MKESENTELQSGDMLKMDTSDVSGFDLIESADEEPKQCSGCGEKTQKDAHFCRACGKSFEEIETAPNLSEGVSPNKSRRIIAIVTTALFLLATVGGGLYVLKSQMEAKEAARAKQEAADKRAADAAEAAEKHVEQARELRTVFNSVAAIDSATSVGVNQRDFGSKVQDGQTALDAYSPPDSACQSVVDDLNAAMKLYTTSNTYWNAAIVDTYSSVSDELLSSGWTQAADLVKKARAKVEAYEQISPPINSIQ